MRLVRHTAGTMTLDGQDIGAADGETLRRARRRFQMVFQDPYASLNPRKRAGDTVREALDLMESGEPSRRTERVAELFAQVGLRPEQQMLFPHQFSGGQRQRIAVARALAAAPALIVCDEPTSALDVSVQAQILNLMKDLQAAHGLTYLFISHNLAVVDHMADRVAVMYLGRNVETADRDTLFARPAHPYTRTLMGSALGLGDVGRRREVPKGEVPNPIDPPPGCTFHPRCPHATALCRTEAPALRAFGGGRVACHHAETLG
jgi:peptide/nickel transport system ATP-binding protein